MFPQCFLWFLTVFHGSSLFFTFVLVLDFFCFLLVVFPFLFPVPLFLFAVLLVLQSCLELDNNRNVEYRNRTDSEWTSVSNSFGIVVFDASQVFVFVFWF